MPQQTTITVLRHGANTLEGDNLSRPLTDEGERQAAARRKALGEPRFDLVLASPALRARQTAEIVGDGTEVRVVDELWLTPALEAVCRTVLEREGRSAPPAAYMAEEPEVARAWGQAAWDAVHFLVGGFGGYSAKSALVAGHNPLINIMGCAAASHLPGVVETLKRVSLGECEGFTLTLEGGRVADLQLHQG